MSSAMSSMTEEDTSDCTSDSSFAGHQTADDSGTTGIWGVSLQFQAIETLIGTTTYGHEFPRGFRLAAKNLHGMTRENNIVTVQPLASDKEALTSGYYVTTPDSSRQPAPGRTKAVDAASQRVLVGQGVPEQGRSIFGLPPRAFTLYSFLMAFFVGDASLPVPNISTKAGSTSHRKQARPLSQWTLCPVSSD
ncbi:hypothetical protein MTO96_034172 [Rhipicephalus appendiculatus]